MSDAKRELFSVIIGGLIVLVSTFGLQYCTRYQEKSSLKSALAAEIKAIGELATYRRIGPAIDNAIKQYDTDNVILLPDISVGREYFIVYYNNASKIGLLDADDAADIARYYVQANAVIEDLNWLSRLSQKGYKKNSSELEKKDLEELKRLYDQTYSLGDKLTKRLVGFY